MFKLLLTVLLLTSLNANAWEKSVGGGLLLNNHDAENSSADEEMDFSIQFGLIAYNELQTNLKLRTGAFYTRKSIKGSFGSTDYEYSFDYITVPATVQFALENSPVHLIGGLNLQIKISDDCDIEGVSCSSSDTDANSLVTPLVLGVAFNLNEQLTGEATYEHALGETADGLEVSSFVFNVLYKL